MPPKTTMTPEEVEKAFREKAEGEGKTYTPYEKSYLAKKNKQNKQPGYMK